MVLMDKLCILYYRLGCGLCEDMYQQLQDLQQEYPFHLEIRDVDSRQDWQQQFSKKVPVLYVELQEVCYYFLDQKTFIQALQRK